MTDKEALKKLDHTLCLNSQLLKFNIDNEYHIDCKDTYEMIDCIEILQETLEEKEKQNEMLKLLKKCYYVSSIDNTLYKTSYGCDNQQDIRKIGEWLENEQL